MLCPPPLLERAGVPTRSGHTRRTSTPRLLRERQRSRPISATPVSATNPVSQQAQTTKGRGESSKKRRRSVYACLSCFGGSADETCADLIQDTVDGLYQESMSMCFVCVCVLCVCALCVCVLCVCVCALCVCVLCVCFVCVCFVCALCVCVCVCV